VVIDLEHGVKYEAQQIDNPNRVFRFVEPELDPKLAGKTDVVTAC
jgi:hypothetical protein